MPLASTEPTAPTRSLPPTAPARDKRAAGTGFASLVDDNAAAKAKAAPRETGRPPEPPAKAAPRDDASADMRETPDRTDSPPTETPSATKTSSSDTPGSASSEQPKPRDTDAAPSDVPAPAVAEVQTDPTIAAAPAPAPLPAPAAVAVAPQAPAPLAIAAAGLAAAQSAAAKPVDAGKQAAGKAVIATAVGSEAGTDDVVIADGTAESDALIGAPARIKLSAQTALPTGPRTDVPTDPNGTASAEGETKPAKTAMPVESKPAPSPAETPKTAPNPVAAADGPAPARPVEHHAASALPAPDGTANTTSVALPQPAQQVAAAQTPAVQLTAAVATAQPVPLNGLAVELAARATTGATRFEIRLDPAELGRIDVRLEIDKHGQVTSHLTVEKPETLAMLRQDSPQLQRALSEAGFKTADGGMQFSLGDPSQSQSQAQQQNGDAQRHAHRLFIQDDEQTAATIPIRDYGRLAAARSGVDISV